MGNWIQRATQGRVPMGILAAGPMHSGRRRAERNLAENEAALAAAGGMDRPIFGQANAPVGTLRFGGARVADVGCEVAAVYNALYLLGQRTGYPMLLYRFERRGQMLRGHFGTNPFVLADRLPEFGLSAVCKNKPEDLAVLAAQHPVCIASFWNSPKTSSGVHTVLVKKAGEGPQLQVYNAYNNDKAPRLYADAADFWKGKGLPVLLMGVDLAPQTGK